MANAPSSSPSTPSLIGAEASCRVPGTRLRITDALSSGARWVFGLVISRICTRPAVRTASLTIRLPLTRTVPESVETCKNPRDEPRARRTQTTSSRRDCRPCRVFLRRHRHRRCVRSCWRRRHRQTHRGKSSSSGMVIAKGKAKGGSISSLSRRNRHSGILRRNAGTRSSGARHRWPRFRRHRTIRSVAPNLLDYERTCADFSWHRRGASWTDCRRTRVEHRP